MKMNGVEKQKNIEGVVFLVLFCLTIPVANWMIGHVGTICVPNARACCRWLPSSWRRPVC